MSLERNRGNTSPVAYVLETTSSSSSQLSEGADQNVLSSSSSSPSLTSALRSFDIGNSSARDISRDALGYPQDESTTHMESYMEYLALLNHRHAQEAMGESNATGGSSSVAIANESLSLLTNATNSLSFGVMSSVNDENGDRAADDGSRSNEAENNNDISSGSSAQVNDFDDVELTLVRDLYSPSASDPGSSNERREGSQDGSFTMNPVISGTSGISQDGCIRLPHLSHLDLSNNSNRTNPVEENSGSSRNLAHHGRTSTLKSFPQPLKLASSTRLKITVLKWNVAASWKWTAGDETCGICRMPFEACCIECKTPGDECPLALGACKHAFHMHCIVKWTETQNTARPQCPLCRQEWKFAPG